MGGRADPAGGQGFKIMLGPDVAFDDVTSTLMSGKADAAYFASLPENIVASTDDNPFFFYTARFGQFVSMAFSAHTNNNAAITMTFALIMVALAACLYYVVGPFVRLARKTPLSTLTPPVAYFCAIGIGFMLIEISQMQRLMVFLGHPSMGSASCCSRSCCSAASAAPRSAHTSPDPDRSPAASLRCWRRCTRRFADAWPDGLGAVETTGMRIVLSVLLLAPPAFCMG
jgi:hypothetical protein